MPLCSNLSATRTFIEEQHQGHKGYKGHALPSSGSTLCVLRILCVFLFHSKCISKPSRSFGSNHVDFGGMIAPAPDTAIRSATPTGYNENATAAWPPSTRF